MSLGAAFPKLLALQSVFLSERSSRKGGLFMGRRKLEIAFGAISGAVGLLVALYTAIIATKE